MHLTEHVRSVRPSSLLLKSPYIVMKYAMDMLDKSGLIFHPPRHFFFSKRARTFCPPKFVPAPLCSPAGAFDLCVNIGCLFRTGQVGRL